MLAGHEVIHTYLDILQVGIQLLRCGFLQERHTRIRFPVSVSSNECPDVVSSRFINIEPRNLPGYSKLRIWRRELQCDVRTRADEFSPKLFEFFCIPSQAYYVSGKLCLIPKNLELLFKIVVCTVQVPFTAVILKDSISESTIFGGSHPAFRLLVILVNIVDRICECSTKIT